MQLEESLIDKYRYINVEHDDWFEYTIDYWKGKLGQVGYDDVETNFSGFWSQGDGASFTAKVRHDEIVLFMQSHDLATKYPHIYTMAGQRYVCLWLSRLSSHYCHEFTVEAEGELEIVYEPDETDDLRELALYEIYNKAEAEWSDFLSDFEEISRDYMKQIYRDLESEYDHLTSDEMVKETLLANDIH